MNIRATLNNQTALDAKVRLQRGATPSTCEVTLPPGSQVAVDEALEVRLGDEVSERVFRQFIARRVETLGDGRIRVHGSDLRDDWNTPVSLTINSTLGGGTHQRETVTLRQAIRRLFERAGRGEEAPVISSATESPPPLRLGGRLSGAFERLLNSVGLTFTVNDDGTVVAEPGDTEPELDRSNLIEECTSRVPVRIVVVGDTALELVTLTDWEPVLPGDDGALRPIADVLSDWGVPLKSARQACLSDGGFEELLPSTGTNTNVRLATLKRYAYRLFRCADSREWIPTGGWSDDGMLTPPKLTARFDRAKGTAPDHPRDDNFESTVNEPVEAFELDAERSVLYLPTPPFALGTLDDPTLQGRALQGDPELSLTIAVPSAHSNFRFSAGNGEQSVVLHAPHLVAVYEQSGEMVNRDNLRSAARELACEHPQEHVTRVRRFAGVVDSSGLGTCESVAIDCGLGGLVSVVRETPSRVAGVLPQRVAVPFVRSGEPKPSGLHQPINAYRGGPLVILAEGETPEGESVLAMKATHRRDDTGALDLQNPGPLAFPFHLASEDAAKFGRWFFVAGVEVTDSGRLRVLAPDERHAELPLTDFFKARHVLPRGLRGLMVSLGEEPVFVDTGPLVSDTRGRQPGASSSLVYDLDGPSLSERRRGGLQFLTVLALSPAHQKEGARDGGWVPALNFREGATGSPETPGRGLFAEGDGHSLGRLTAKSQGGPILADADNCTKHLYGAASDDGTYRESSGHISTDAFFKFPGDPIHDAPLKFYPRAFRGGIPPWPPYEAQIKYDAAEKHPWDRKQRDGRWKIQYRVPFLPEIPPTWRPPIKPPTDDPPQDDPPIVDRNAMQKVPRTIDPAVSEFELWAPSHDWLPAPSDRDNERDVPMRGPSVTSEGWAGEVDGIPDPSLGGGCIYLPGDVPMPDAQIDRGTRQTYLALHPEVVLAFGHPGFTGDAQGHVHSGWAIQLAGDQLKFEPRDEDAATEGGLSHGVHVTGHMQVGPDGASFSESQALRLGAGTGEGIAFGGDVALYRNSSDTLRTDGDLEVGGKLTVDGLIDPTGLEFDAQASNPGNVAANTLWINSNDGGLYLGDNKIAFEETPSD